MERRNLVTGGLVGLAALLGPASAGSAAAAQAPESQDVARALDSLRDLFERHLESPFPELADIRAQQRSYLKVNQKFPDFIDVGAGVWERVFDWHIRHQQTPAIARRDDGRYVMSLLVTTLVLRPEQNDGYVSFGYDLPR